MLETHLEKNSWNLQHEHKRRVLHVSRNPGKLELIVTCRALKSLGRSSLKVPHICMGTMLFGESLSVAESHALLNQCWEAGVNFFDSAEMYPVPQCEETQGASEKILGEWMRGKRREDIIVATKVSGPSAQMSWIRGGPERVDATNIRSAVDQSLLGLQTDYIDLYQVHWPDRYVPMFGDMDYDPNLAYSSVPIEEQLEALADAVTAGKVRQVGVSNETAWGLMKWLRAAEQNPSLPRVASIQNAYSLLCRTFDASLAEVCHLEEVGLLAYSPLAMGLLTGKYQEPEGADPEARLNKYRGRYAEAESRYGFRPPVLAAVSEYCGIAREAGMSPTELAIRFVVHHPLVTATVIGCRTSKQLEELLRAASSTPLPNDIRELVNAVHGRWPNPTP